MNENVRKGGEVKVGKGSEVKVGKGSELNAECVGDEKAHLEMQDS
jgi:hypothetical protein